MNLKELTVEQGLVRSFYWLLDSESFARLSRAPSIQRHIFFELVDLQDTWGPVVPVTAAQEITKPYRGHSERWHYKAHKAGVQP